MEDLNSEKVSACSQTGAFVGIHWAGVLCSFQLGKLDSNFCLVRLGFRVEGLVHPSVSR